MTQLFLYFVIYDQTFQHSLNTDLYVFQIKNKDMGLFELNSSLFSEKSIIHHAAMTDSIYVHFIILGDLFKTVG